jgi:hypothetical protein
MILCTAGGHMLEGAMCWSDPSDTVSWGWRQQTSSMGKGLWGGVMRGVSGESCVVEGAGFRYGEGAVGQHSVLGKGSGAAYSMACTCRGWWYAQDGESHAAGGRTVLGLGKEDRQHAVQEELGRWGHTWLYKAALGKLLGDRAGSHSALWRLLAGGPESG